MSELAAVILAAGKGTRMQSDLPKVVHEAADAPMIRWVVQACRDAGCARIVLIVGHGRDLVREAVREDATADGGAIEFALQEEQLGTAHAVRCAEPALERFTGDVLVLCGDGPLVRGETLSALVQRHRDQDADMTLATSVLEDPSGYGRIVRDEQGRFAGIVEQKSATPEQLAIREVNPSYYCVRSDALFEGLNAIAPDERTGEYYITDLPAVVTRRGGRVEVVDAVPPEEAMSVNTPEQLAEATAVLRQRGATL